MTDKEQMSLFDLTPSEIPLVELPHAEGSAAAPIAATSPSPSVNANQPLRRVRTRNRNAAQSGLDCRFDSGDWPRVTKPATDKNAERVFYRDSSDCWQSLPPRMIEWQNWSAGKQMKSVMTMGLRKPTYSGSIERRYSQYEVQCNTGIIVYGMDFLVIPLRDDKRGARSIDNPLKRESDFHVVDRHSALQPDDMAMIEPFKEVSVGEYGIFDYAAFHDSKAAQPIYTFHCQ